MRLLLNNIHLNNAMYRLNPYPHPPPCLSPSWKRSARNLTMLHLIVQEPCGLMDRESKMENGGQSMKELLRELPRYLVVNV